MIRILDLTVYELLGYLLPGSVAFLGLFFAAGAVYPPWLEAERWQNLGLWGTLPVAGAYVVGHVAQAIANRVFGRTAEDVALDEVIKDIPESGFSIVARRMAMTDEGAALRSNRRAFLAVCTEILDQDGKTSMRDVFLYREGFYRGTCISMSVLAFGLLIYEHTASVGREFLVLSASIGLCIGISAAFAVRYKRFARYRINSCIWGALTVCAAAFEKKTSDTTPDDDG